MNRSNLPWIREYQGGFSVRRLLSGMLAVVFVAAVSLGMCLALFEAIDRTQMAVEDSYQRGRRDMRGQILRANQDILKGQELYIRQMDALIKKEYRSKR